MCRDISAKTSVQRAGCSGPAQRWGVGLRAACSSFTLSFDPAVSAARAGRPVTHTTAARALQQHVPTCGAPDGTILSFHHCRRKKKTDIVRADDTAGTPERVPVRARVRNQVYALNSMQKLLLKIMCCNTSEEIRNQYLVE